MTKAAELAKMGEVLTNSQIGGRRNMIINGAMQVAQRGTSATDLGASDGYFTVDRFQLNFSSTSARFTMTQDSPTDLSGFTKALKLDCTTADTSIGAAEYLILHYKLEGFDVQQLKKGTSDAEKFTISFYVKGNANATYTLEIEDVDNNRYNAQEFSVTTSWNRVSLTFDGDTTGVLGNDNGNSIRLNFWLFVGSNFTSGTHTDNVWHTTATQRVGDNQTSLADSTDRTFFLTGIQLEVGSQATPFEHRSFGEELALCQRYFEKVSTTVNYHLLIAGQCFSSTGLQFLYPFKVVKRASASFTFSAAGTFTAVTSNGSNTGAATDISATSTTDKEMRGTLTVSSGLSAGDASVLSHFGGQSDEATVNIDAEL
jgi:hypothetical protein